MTADQSRNEDHEREEELIDVSRRQFLKFAGIGGVAASLGGVLLSAWAKGGPASSGSAANIGVTGQGNIKIGVPAPCSGRASFPGVIVNQSLNAGVARLQLQCGI